MKYRNHGVLVSGVYPISTAISPIYYLDQNGDNTNWVTLKADEKLDGGASDIHVQYFVKYCYDEKTDTWVEDKAYKGSYVEGWYTDRYIFLGYIEAAITLDEFIEQTREDITNGKKIKGEAVKPEASYDEDRWAEYDPDTRTATCPDGSVIYPDGCREYPDGHIEYPEGHIEYSVNTLGATVTFSTDCIKVKTNKKGVVAQKPLPKSVKVGGKTLKRNKTFKINKVKLNSDMLDDESGDDESVVFKTKPSLIIYMSIR